MLPRLIDLDHDGNRCRLLDSSGLKPQPYVALSYCWGTQVENSGRVLQTTGNNIRKSMFFVSQLDLPRLLRDAVHLTQGLGIRCLWIDAICIVQDNDQNWQAHVAHMAEIYEHAYLVVAAGSARHSNDSFLHVGDRPSTHKLTYTAKGKAGPVSFRRLNATGLHETYEGMYGALDPLDRRAWSLQERILATRLINFSSTELQWMCKTHLSCEAAHLDSERNNLSLYKVKRGTEDAYTFLHRLVVEYSRRSLTFEKDKLPALAGVASKAKTLSGSEYLAGVWFDRLDGDFCWERHLWEILPWEATEEWRAPSFSWVSVERNVLYNDEGLGDGTGWCERRAGVLWRLWQQPQTEDSPYNRNPIAV
jgi:hypothetical protein